MNPADRFKIDNYRKIVKEIEKIGRLEYLHDLEDKVIKEIVHLVLLGTDEAKLELKKLEKMLEEDVDCKPRNKLLISALTRSIRGALSAAKLCII